MEFQRRVLVSLIVVIVSGSASAGDPSVSNLQQHLNNRHQEPEVYHKCYARLVHSSMSANCSRLGYTSVPRNVAKTVRILDLSLNFLRRIVAGDFDEYASLEMLRLNSNLLDAVEEGSFKVLSELQVLNLRSNRIAHLTAEHFTGLERLRTLDLGRNPLHHLNSSVFDRLPYLSHLYLDGCSLETIDSSILHALPYIESLDISHNHLKAIDGQPPSAESIPKSLKMLDMSHNPWTCDCSMRWLAEYLHDSTGSLDWYFFGSGPRCREPLLYSGLNWKDLHPSRFLCQPVIIGTEAANAPLSIARYGNVSLVCNSTGGPKPDVVWTFNGRRVGEVKQLRHRHVISERAHEDRPGRHVVASALFVYGMNEFVAGKYACLVGNLAGSSELSYFVSLAGDDATRFVGVVNGSAAGEALLSRNSAMYKAALVLVCATASILVGLVVWCLVGIFGRRKFILRFNGDRKVNEGEDLFFIRNVSPVNDSSRSNIYRPKVTKI